MTTSLVVDTPQPWTPPCATTHTFRARAVTVPSPAWNHTVVPQLVHVRNASWSLCPRALTCTRMTPRTCRCEMHLDWIDHIDVVCPSADACLETCFLRVRGSGLWHLFLFVALLLAVHATLVHALSAVVEPSQDNTSGAVPDAHVGVATTMVTHAQDVHADA